jgi:serine/threonine protein kinase
MALPAGARFGPYEIRALLGAGGMGDVYRARDSGLNRDVALKVLPDLFAFDPERLARFKREAQVLASLNHPNIAAIFGVEETEGVRALVLELVEGETLADRIARGPVPLDDALPIARQITEALEAAHEGGVIHRDLKPDNIKVRPDGIVKVLDFGLAKLAETAGAGEVSRAGALLSQSPTITSPAAVTGVGMLLGTAAYMSPEQAKGREADKRSDVWAFGCVLFEMLTGRRAFGGEDVTDTIAAVVRADPDWRALPADTPSPVRRLLRRCLEKDRRERIPDIAVARIELRDALREPATEIGASQSAGSTRAQRAPRWGFAAAMAVAGLALVAATGAAVWNLKPESSSAASPVSRFTISLPPGEQLAQLGWLAVAVSPDGSRFAYVASRGTDVPGARQIYVRELSSLEARPVMGTEGANNPFFSADGEWLGFYQAGSF